MKREDKLQLLDSKQCTGKIIIQAIKTSITTLNSNCQLFKTFLPLSLPKPYPKKHLIQRFK